MDSWLSLIHVDSIMNAPIVEKINGAWIEMVDVSLHQHGGLFIGANRKVKSQF